jgi:hypothetical protein
MKMSLELKGIILGTISGLAAVGIAFAVGEVFQPKPAAASGAPEAIWRCRLWAHRQTWAANCS